MRGRKPLPTELHILNGNPGHRPLQDTVRSAPGRPDYPSYLDEAGRAEWDRACDLLDEMGILCKADSFALEMFVETWGRYREACRNVDQYGMVQCLDKTKRKFAINPYLRVRNALWEQLHKMLGDFGFSPVARARLKNVGANDVEEDDPLTAILRKRAEAN